MDADDRLILENEVAVSLGRVVSEWLERHGIGGEMSADIVVSRPSCYFDDSGKPHTGPLVIVDVVVESDEE